MTRSVEPMTPNVVVVCMPEQSERLVALRAADIPRLVVVAAGTAPPTVVGDHEEWIRFPADAAEVHARLEALSARVARSAPPRPSLDDDGLLHVGARWVALSATNEKLADTLLADFGHVIPTSTLMLALKRGKTTRTVRPYITRLRQSIEPLGLVVISVRSRGYLMNFAYAM
jgi:hypothetical protein